MIYLKKGQPVADNPNLVVYDSTGYYNDGDPVICASAELPEEPVCRYEAKYIQYGGMVYSISNPDELMAEILKTDPASLFGKDSQQIAVDKMVEKIVPQEPGQAVEEATTEVVDTTDTVTDTATEEAATNEATTTDPFINTGDGEIIDITSTTTADSIIPEAPEVIPPLGDTSTTSPASIIDVDVGTSTDTTSNL